MWPSLEARSSAESCSRPHGPKGAQQQHELAQAGAPGRQGRQVTPELQHGVEADTFQTGPEVF